MDEFDRLLADAKNKVTLADYMLTNTYRLLKDPKLLVSIFENVYEANVKALTSLLVFERAFKRVPSFGESMPSKLVVFKKFLDKNKQFDRSYLTLLEEMYELHRAYEDSAVDFSRQEKFVMASDNYDLSTISVEKIQNYLKRCKTFISFVYDVFHNQFKK